MIEFTNERSEARTFSTFDECLEYKDSIATPHRQMCRINYRDPAIGEKAGFLIVRTASIQPFREDWLKG
mgnify:CR=1 FL=1